MGNWFTPAKPQISMQAPSQIGRGLPATGLTDVQDWRTLDPFTF